MKRRLEKNIYFVLLIVLYFLSLFVHMKMTLKKRNKLPKSNHGRKLKYPFDAMQIGHFLEMPVKNEGQKKKFYSVFTAARRYGYRHGLVFSSRIISNKGSIQRTK